VRLISRYLLAEIVFPLAAWVAFLFVLLLVGAILQGPEVLLGSSVTVGDLGRFTLYLTPHFLMQALPVAFLLALLLGLGRLAEDRELTALQAVGVGPWRLLGGPLALGVALSAGLLYLSFSAQPAGMRAVRGMANEVIKRNLVGDVKPGVFYEDLAELTLYAERVDEGERHWRHVLVHDNREPSSPLLVLAREGTVNPAGEASAFKLVLNEGTVHRDHRTRGEYTTVDFEGGELVMGVGDAFFLKNRFRSPKEELTPRELLQSAGEARARGEDPRGWMVAFHSRVARVLMPLAFAMLGTPLAIGRRRTGRAWGYLLTLLGYVGYYVLARVFVGLGERGQLLPLLAGHLPNAICVVAGLWALARINRTGMGTAG
jgi:lipopolysaccharide export system permease protein